MMNSMRGEETVRMVRHGLVAAMVLLLPAGVFAAAIPDTTLAVDRLLREMQPVQKIESRRLYRADAVVTVFNIPILSRVGVGSGYAVYEERAEAESRTISLQFAGGSRPDRA